MINSHLLNEYSAFLQALLRIDEILRTWNDDELEDVGYLLREIQAAIPASIVAIRKEEAK